MRLPAACLAALAALAALPTVAVANDGTRFRIVNRTGEVAIGLYAAEPGSEGRNLIAGRTMRPGQTAEVTRAGGGCRVDVRLVTAGGSVHDRRGVDVCETAEIAIGTAAPAEAALPADLVAAAQRRLAALGFDPGAADGQLGPRTQAAIAAFQRDRGLAATGRLDAGTIAALRAAAPEAEAAQDGKPPPLPGAGPVVAGKPPPPQGPDRPQPIPGRTAAIPAPGPSPPRQEGQGQEAQGQHSQGQRPLRRASTGTGFVVAEGRLLTNQHVIAECAAVAAVLPGNRRVPLQVLVSDRQRDLALLGGPRDMGPSLAFREGAPRRGDEVVTYGFPLTGILGSGPTLTTGEVSGLTGLRDDPNTFIISAPVQSGNSGGPLLDRSGNVLGVIVAKLNALRVAERTGGDLPQNVNIAIHGRVALDFLRRNGITPRTAASSGTRPAAEVGEIAHPSTALIECLR